MLYRPCMLCNIVRQIEKCKKKKNFSGVPLNKSGLKKWNGSKCVQSKIRFHFLIPTFWALQLCTLVPGWFKHLKWPKTASCLWFWCFSSHVKRCRHTRMQRFTRELKRPNQRQGPFLGHLKCSNHPGTKVQSWRSQKVGITEWHWFFDSMQFAYAQCPLVGFICRKELLQQNGPQGQN